MKVNPSSSQERSPDQVSVAWTSSEPPREANSLGQVSSVQEKRYTGFDLWLHRLTMLLFVFVCAVMGVLLVILPWRPEWTDNRLLLIYPGLRAFIANGFVRGICTGLGLMDIVIGFWEAIHYHEGKRT